MDVRKLLEEVKRGDTSIEEAENAFKNLPYEDLGYAKLDLHRKLRSGFPETVFCQGKPDAYLADIFETLYRENGEVLGTRATPEQWNLVRARIPEIEYDPVSKILQARKSSETPRKLEGLVQSAQAQPGYPRLRRKLPKRQNFSAAAWSATMI